MGWAWKTWPSAGGPSLKRKTSRGIRPNRRGVAPGWGGFPRGAAQSFSPAIAAADSTDPAMIREAIATTINYPGVVGAYKAFNGKGAVTPQWKWLGHYPGGGGF